MKRRFFSLLLSALLLLALPPLSHSAQAFSDLEDGFWAAEVIRKADDYGLLEGYPDGRFGVGDPMTRAQFVTVLARMFSWPLPAQTAPAWSDCAGHWAQPYLSAALQEGVVDDGADLFRPDAPITRLEMARLLVQALGYESLAQSLSGQALPFPDASEDRGYIAVAYALGLLTGIPEGDGLVFLPHGSAPREQAAAVLVRCYERRREKTSWLHGFYAFHSYSQIGLSSSMDAVSVGWARLEMGEDGPQVNSTAENGNEWVKPQQSELATGFFAQHAVPCNLNVYADADAFSALINSGGQALAVSRLVQAAGPYAGLTIDWEGLRSDRREDFTLFLSALRAALPREKALYVCVQPDTWFGGYDYRALGRLCDKVILMAHDYQWTSIPDSYVGTDNTYCPVTPFDQVFTALWHATDPQTGIEDRGKLALAISFNTAGFHVDENGRLLESQLYHPSTETIAQRLAQPDTLRQWDEASRNPCLTYTTAEGERYRLWYEDAQSVADKLALGRMFGVTGVSVWRLGIIPAYPDISNYHVWQVLSQR